MTIKKSLLFSIIFFVIMPVLSLPFVTSKIYEDILERKINESMQQNLVQIGNNLENAIDSMAAASNILLSDQELMDILRKPDPNDEIESFYDYKSVDVKIAKSFSAALVSYQADLILWGANGKVYATTGEYAAYDYEEIVAQMWYRDTIRLQGYLEWLTPAGRYKGLDAVGKRNNIVMTRSMIDPIDSVSYGVLAVSLYPSDKLLRLFAADEPSGGTRLFLVDDDDRVILADDKEKLGRFLDDIADLPEAAYINTYRLDKTNWSIVQYIPHEDVTREAKKLRAYNLAINAVFMVVLVIISVIISNRIANPLHRLSLLMSRVARGDFSARMKTKGKNNEIDRLSRSFNIMVEDMEKLIAELQLSYEMREKLRLAALQAQINPHFLFNTLNSIKWMAVVHGAGKVSEMISALGQLLEATLSRNEEMVPLSVELGWVESYVILQKMRFGEKFELTVDLPEELLAYKVPALLFQPLIENAIIHGFADRDSGGSIGITGEANRDKVCIDIVDNGKGMSEETLRRITEGVNSERGRFNNIGVRNVQDRIVLRYGSAYGLSVTSEEGAGTTIRLTLPPLNRGVGDAEAFDRGR